MSKLLYIQASPREGRSYSRAVSDAFVDAYRKKHPQDSVDVLDVFKEKIPDFDGSALQAKYNIMHGEKHTDEQLKAWKNIEVVIERFKSADKYVISLPMWNFGIPYRLKQYLDVILQPGYTFSFSPDTGYSGLVKGKPVLAIYARGGEYSEGPAVGYDFQKKYLELALGFIGFQDIKSVVIEPTLAAGPDTAASKKEAALQEALKLVESF